jgi:hypothetical protein
MKRLAGMLFVMGFPFMLQAADIPTNVLEADRYDKSACIQRTADQCVNLRCASGPYSSDRNCPEKCQSAAKAQCAVSSE